MKKAQNSYCIELEHFVSRDFYPKYARIVLIEIQLKKNYVDLNDRYFHFFVNC